MQHCVSASVETTDWSAIVGLYDRLLQLRDSPIYALNRAIAVAQGGGDPCLGFRGLLDGASLAHRSELVTLGAAHELLDQFDEAPAPGERHEFLVDRFDEREGMLLLSALPHVEKVPKSWQGPSPIS